MTNRESICKQQIHCLSCPLSVRITGKDCRTLTQKELSQLKVKEFENTCIVCGMTIPEGRQVCPICESSESDVFGQKKSVPQPEFKPIDEIEQAYRKGVEEGMKQACEIKQENQQLKHDIAILKAAIERRDNENNQDGWFE